MTKQLLVGAICALLSVAVVAQEAAEAPKSIIADYIELCTSYATEDGIGKDDMDSYLLECVNTELTDNGYKEVKSLKQE